MLKVKCVSIFLFLQINALYRSLCSQHSTVRRILAHQFWANIILCSHPERASRHQNLPINRANRVRFSKWDLKNIVKRYIEIQRQCKPLKPRKSGSRTEQRQVRKSWASQLKIFRAICQRLFYSCILVCFQN